MLDFVVVVESSADAQTATKLAERVFVERVDWLEPEYLQGLFRWGGLEEGSEYSCWRDIRNIMQRAKESGLPIPKFLGHGRSGALKADGAATMKILNLIRCLQLKNIRKVRAVLLIRDLDNQPERREGIEQARAEHIEQQPKLEIIIGAADPMREAWVLNGFTPASRKEVRALENIKNQLNFDPCEDSHRLRSNSWEEPERIRNPKIVLEELTKRNKLREQSCWEETSLELLQQRGTNTGLTAYLWEIEQRLIPVILE
ncbi:hypothetical protein L3556_09250 [Candidatus Synechococcus calcipolaris G9]|uniref:DUF4276 family protein n=1 Tax=Candidatus Synechococcus calcipolaris G9 TaxID=1497997 RepID=A0ABT6EZV3_9SYNE|nr:hypothetical protein [Candidatus Synechococcus calcipolaris]MDG2991110.1 hypothetical protein [Candidatus Synechococcus calcipolaris G9]